MIYCVKVLLGENGFLVNVAVKPCHTSAPSYILSVVTDALPPAWLEGLAYPDFTGLALEAGE